MYSLFRDAGMLETWKMRFCNASFDQCERFKMSALGRPVPRNLLPTGALLKYAG